MPKKIKRLVSHIQCKWVPVSQLFLGFKTNEFAILEQDKINPVFGLLQQCSICKKVQVFEITKDEGVADGK